MRRNPDSRKTQCSRILQLLIQARGGWVPLPEILALGIAQYNARLWELRRLGFRIENRTERRDGQRHSYFRLAMSATPGDQSLTPETSPQADNRESIQGAQRPEPLSLFGDLKPESEYPD